MIINDATGRGYAAKVTSDNRLAVQSSQLSEAAQAAREGRSFIASTIAASETLTINATGGPMILLRNNSTTEYLFIDEVTISSDNAKLFCKEEVASTIGTISQSDTGAAYCTLTGRPDATQASVVVWDGSSGNAIAGTSNATNLAISYLTTGVTTLRPGGSTVVSPGSNYSISLKNGSGGTLKANVSIRFYVGTL